MENNVFESLAYQYFENDLDFLDKLVKINPEWDRSKLYRIKSGRQTPKITDVKDISIALDLPFEEVAKLFIDVESVAKNTHNEKPIYMSIKDTSNALGISTYALRQWIKGNKIPYIKVGQKYLVDVENTLLILRNGDLNDE